MASGRHAVQRLRTVSHAFHSSLMHPMLDRSSEVAGESYPNLAPRLDVVSNVRVDAAQAAEVADARTTGGAGRTSRSSSRRASSPDRAGLCICIELGPAPVLTALGRRCVGDEGMLWVPSLREGRRDWDQLLDGLGRLYVDGVDIDWAGFDQEYARKRVVLPTYAFQHRDLGGARGQGAAAGPTSGGGASTRRPTCGVGGHAGGALREPAERPARAVSRRSGVRGHGASRGGDRGDSRGRGRRPRRTRAVAAGGPAHRHAVHRSGQPRPVAGTRRGRRSPGCLVDAARELRGRRQWGAYYVAARVREDPCASGVRGPRGAPDARRSAHPLAPSRRSTSTNSTKLWAQRGSSTGGRSGRSSRSGTGTVRPSGSSSSAPRSLPRAPAAICTRCCWTAASSSSLRPSVGCAGLEPTSRSASRSSSSGTAGALRCGDT